MLIFEQDYFIQYIINPHVYKNAGLHVYGKKGICIGRAGTHENGTAAE